jgi:bis(5'-nucleosidyl)-tetraphosphatase
MQFPEVTAPYCIALEKSVGAVLFRVVRNDQQREAVEYLLIRYPHGHWEFPRGHVENGETEVQTAFREVEEETGIVESALRIRDDFREYFSFGYRARGSEKKERIAQKRCLLIRKKAVFYLAEVVGDFRNIELSDEHTDHIWLAYGESQKRLTHGNARKLLKKVHVYLSR